MHSVLGLITTAVIGVNFIFDGSFISILSSIGLVLLCLGLASIAFRMVFEDDDAKDDIILLYTSVVPKWREEYEIKSYSHSPSVRADDVDHIQLYGE